jgi:CRP/FNR family cyclic AMP-dependent transcriptional regulator
VLEGLMTRTLTIADRSSTEVIGAGDLLRPWQRDGEDGLVPTRVDFRVLERACVALLDGRFAAAIAPWPQIGAELTGRALRRARWQGVLMTLSHMTRVDQRLLLLFWHFAERWGRVRPDGVVVRLPLTHETLGALIGARRPSVTSALSALAGEGLLEPLDRGEWKLTEAAHARLEELRSADEWPIRLAA